MSTKKPRKRSKKNVETTDTTVVTTQTRSTVNKAPEKHRGLLNDACLALGLNRLPNDRLAAVAAARTLKSEWDHDQRSLRPLKLERALREQVNITSNLRAVRHSSLHPAATALVTELIREVPPTVSAHPQWGEFVAALQSAIS